jgi:NTP pyrophosphatase (non-canonical NTP hydrolase)
MKINQLRDEAAAYAKKQGFHENINFSEKLMLDVSELSEAMEAARKDKWAANLGGIVSTCWSEPGGGGEINIDAFETYIRGSVEEELADAIIRLCDLAGIYNIDLEWHIKTKMAYNKTRPLMHGKKF